MARRKLTVEQILDAAPHLTPSEVQRIAKAFAELVLKAGGPPVAKLKDNTPLSIHALCALMQGSIAAQKLSRRDWESLKRTANYRKQSPRLTVREIAKKESVTEEAIKKRITACKEAGLLP